MSDTKYTYAVARIRALEVSLFSSSTIEQLIACKDHESCLRFLTEHGWGGVDVPLNADAILTREQEKIWETIREMQVDMDVFDVLSYPNWFHNLKAAVKEVCTGKSGANIYFEGHFQRGNGKDHPGKRLSGFTGEYAGSCQRGSGHAASFGRWSAM